MDRTEAREVAFQALYQLEFTSGDDEEFYQALAIENAVEVYQTLEIENDAVEEGRKVQRRRLTYIENAVKGTRKYLKEIDEIIKPYLKTGWTLERLATADRNILRLAVYEMHFAEDKLSMAIAINEAVKLAKKYGADESSRFVNGVLNSIGKNLAVSD